MSADDENNRFALWAGHLFKLTSSSRSRIDCAHLLVFVAQYIEPETSSKMDDVRGEKTPGDGGGGQSRKEAEAGSRKSKVSPCVRACHSRSLARSLVVIYYLRPPPLA